MRLTAKAFFSPRVWSPCVLDSGSPPSALFSRGRAYAGALTCSVSVLLFLPPLSCSFPFAVVCPEKEVKFQRAPNGEPCLPTHLPTPCCLCPPAGHANPFCHVRALHSSSLHVCAVWAGVARPAGRGPLPKVPQEPKRWALECACRNPGQRVKLAGTRGQGQAQGETLTHCCPGGEALLPGHGQRLPADWQPVDVRWAEELAEGSGL